MSEQAGQTKITRGDYSVVIAAASILGVVLLFIFLEPENALIATAGGLVMMAVASLVKALLAREKKFATPIVTLFLYAAYELVMQSGGFNIRIDLLFVLPVVFSICVFYFSSLFQKSSAAPSRREEY